MSLKVGPVFRAEKHNTKRHLNEYTSLDFEMGYIDRFEDFMAMETGFLQYMVELLKEGLRKELEILGIDLLPKTKKSRRYVHDEAKQLVSEKYNRKDSQPIRSGAGGGSTDWPLFQGRVRQRLRICHHYPSKKRPFYAMDDPEDKPDLP